MRTQHLTRGLLTAAGAVLGLVAGPALGSAQANGAARVTAVGALPKVPADLSATRQYLKIRPQYIGYTGDGTGILQGRGNRGILHWTSWTTSHATGSGYDRIDTCDHSCAGGPWNYYPVHLEAWRPAVVHGQLVFTRLTRWYTGRRPKGQPVHFTWTDLYQNGGWGFSPPDALGYCTQTNGQPAFAGCANINALP